MYSQIKIIFLLRRFFWKNSEKMCHSNKIHKYVSVAYGYMMKLCGTTSDEVSIQENGVVIEVDLNKEGSMWCKIRFFRNDEKQQNWYSWQKIENVELEKKHARLK